MYELRIKTHSGKTLSFCSTRFKLLHKQLAAFAETFGYQGWAIRDSSGWSDSAGWAVDRDTPIPSIIIWNEESIQ